MPEDQATLNASSKVIESTIERIASMKSQVRDMEAILHQRLDRLIGFDPSETTPTIVGSGALKPEGYPPPRAPASSVADHIRELDEAIASLNYQLNRLA